MPQAVLFDLDGTLLDTEPDFTLILNQMLLHHGHTEVKGELVRTFVSAGAGAVVRQGFRIQESDPRHPELLAEFLERYSRQIPATLAGLFSDIDLLLAALNDTGVPWGIMTNKARRFSEPLLARFETFSTCATLVCPDDVGKGKPDPAGLLLACSHLSLPPADVLYVGDHPRDIEAATRAGMPGVAVSWGYLPVDSHIDDWGASFVAHSPQDLIGHLSLQGN